MEEEVLSDSGGEEAEAMSQPAVDDLPSEVE